MGSSITAKVVTNFLSKVRIRGEGRVGSQVGNALRSGVVLLAWGSTPAGAT